MSRSEVSESVEMSRLLDQLRKREGWAVTINCSNPEPSNREDAEAVDAVGDWTNWEDRRFTGETLLLALRKANGAMADWEMKGDQ